MFKKSVTDASKLILNFAATTPEIIRAKKNAKRFTTGLAKADSEGSNLRYELNLNYCHYGLGDFVMELVLAKVIQTAIPNVRISKKLIGVPPYINQLSQSGISKNHRLGDFAEILSSNPTNIDFTEESCFDENEVDIRERFGWQQTRDFFLSSANGRLINQIAKTFGLNPTQIFPWKPRGEYVGVHIRGSGHSKQRNASLQIVKNDILFLSRQFPNLNIRIFSSPAPDFLPDLLEELRGQSIRVEMQKSQNFTQAIDEALGSDFWFQRLGGGMAVPVLHSLMPYVVLSNDTLSKYIFGMRLGQFAKWSLKTQSYLVNQRAANESITNLYLSPGENQVLP